MTPFLLLYALSGAPTTAAAIDDHGPTVEAADAVFAVVVGNNRSRRPQDAPLRYADDDAARWTEWLEMSGADVEVLSVLDPETQALHPDVARRARVPERRVLEETLASVFDRVRAARAEGRRAIFYFVFVGHGSVESDGQGHMHLLDGTLRRSDLYREIVGPSPADLNHVIIDACHAYLMVARRGAGGARLDAALQDFLADEDLDRHPDTGVFVSTSKAAEVHEWSRFSAGIFSHELRSALTGAADVDDDGAVGYDEARAFVAAANARIDNPKAKLEVFAQAPRIHVEAPLFVRGRLDPAVPRLSIPRRMAGRWSLQDARGVRYADFNFSPDADLELALVPASAYFLQAEDREIEIPTAALRYADVGRLVPRPRASRPRSAEVESFRKDLFAVPFGPAYFEGFRASSPSVSSPTKLRLQADGPRPRKVAGISVLVGGVAAAAVGVGFLVASGDTATDFRQAIGDDDAIDALGDRARRQDTIGKVLIGVGAALGAAGILTWAM